MTQQPYTNATNSMPQASQPERKYGGGNMGEVDGDTKVIVNGKRQ